MNNDILKAMNLVANCNIAWLDRTNDSFPTGGYEVAHDTGRWWDSMLRYEAVTGVSIPTDVEQKMLLNVKKLMDNQIGMLVNRPVLGLMKDKAIFLPHNLRESFLTLAGLVKSRNSQWAEETGHRLLETLKKVINNDGTFDFIKMAEMVETKPHPSLYANIERDWTSSAGRALEAILLFHKETEDPLAMELAERIASFHLSNTVHSDGSAVERIFSEENIGHNHSYLGTLRGLLLYGLITGSDEYICAVSNTYDNSIWKNNITWVGWAPHDLGKRRFNNEDGDPEADPASCGDVAQIALWLAMFTGRKNLLDDVERLTRATLLASQIQDDPDPRRKGAWGIHRQPFEQGVILDVFAAILHSLTDIYSNIVTSEKPDEVAVNLHFKTSTEWLDIDVSENRERNLVMHLKKKMTLKIRIPGWLNHDEITLKVDGRKHQIKHWEGTYAIISQSELKEKSVVELSYVLPITQTTETMKISRKEYKLTWKGDTVINCLPEVPIYPCNE